MEWMDQSLQMIWEYILQKKNQSVATRALQRVTNKSDEWAAKRGLTFSPSKTVNRKKNKEPVEIMPRDFARKVPS